MPKEKTDAEKTAERQAKALENLTSAFEGLKAKVEAKPEKPTEGEGKKPVVYTRAQLRKMVNDGQITEDQMDAQLEQQLRESVRAEVKTEIAQTTETATRKATLSAQIDAHTDAHPELKDQNSDLFKKVAAKFNELVGRGLPKGDLATELTAIEMVVGGAKGRKRELEATEETGGDGDAGKGGGAEDDGPWKGIPAKNREYYKKQIAKGIYSGTGDARLKKELARIRGAN